MRDFSVVLFLVLVAISSYLATIRQFGGWALAGCIVASAVSVAIIHNLDRLEQLVLRRGGRRASDPNKRNPQRRLRKSDQLQKVADGIARFTAASIVSENRLVGEDHPERMLRRRDELEDFLTEAGVPIERQSELLSRITRMADWDLRGSIASAALSASKLREPERIEFRAELSKILGQADRVAALREVRELLRQRDIASPDLAAAISRYDSLLTSGRLPKTGRADDLDNAPLD